MDQRIIKEKSKFSDYLKNKGVKLSPARKAVFHEVMHLHGHFAPEELVKQCSDNNKKVSRASIYRCLKELLEAGVIRETAYGDKHNHYEHIYDEKPHHHARCVRCADLIEIPDLNEEKKYEPILEKLNFQILGHEMVFYGICEKCQD